MDKTNSRDVHLKIIWTYLRTYPDKFLRFSLILTLNFVRIFSSFFYNFDHFDNFGHLQRQSRRPVTFETLITILTIENLKS